MFKVGDLAVAQKDLFDGPLTGDVVQITHLRPSLAGNFTLADVIVLRTGRASHNWVSTWFRALPLTPSNNPKDTPT